MDKTFGVKKPNCIYKDREGAYAVIKSFDNRFATVKTPAGYFLLGGGIEPGETHDDCIIRECIEEAGIIVKVNSYICKAEEYFYSTTNFCEFHTIGNYYFCEILRSNLSKIEKDFKLIWLTYKECESKFFLKNQVYAIEKYICLLNGE